MSDAKIKDTREELEEYANLSNDEFGKACHALLNLVRCSCISAELKTAADKEIHDNLEWCKENLKIVESTQTYTRTVRELEMM